MASNKSNKSNESEEDTMTEQTTDQAVTRSDAINVGPDKGGNLLAAWRGVHNLLGGQATFRLTPEGIVADNFSIDTTFVSDPNTVVNDVSGRERRVDLVDSYPILQGEAPAPFTDPLEMTKWMQQYARTPGEGGKSPDYIKAAIAAYKVANGFPGRRGRPKKIVKIDQLGQLPVDILSKLPAAELASLKANIAQAEAAQSAAAAEVTA